MIILSSGCGSDEIIHRDLAGAVTGWFPIANGLWQFSLEPWIRLNSFFYFCFYRIWFHVGINDALMKQISSNKIGVCIVLLGCRRYDLIQLQHLVLFFESRKRSEERRVGKECRAELWMDYVNDR